MWRTSVTAGCVLSQPRVWFVTTLAEDGMPNFKDEPGLSAEFNGLNGIAIDQQGNLYVADQYNIRIRKITMQ